MEKNTNETATVKAPEVPASHPVVVVYREHSDQEKKFFFRKPRRDEVNAYVTKMRSKPVDAGINLCISTVWEEHKSALAELLKEEFGFAVNASGRVLEQVGFTQD